MLDEDGIMAAGRAATRVSFPQWRIFLAAAKPFQGVRADRSAFQRTKAHCIHNRV